MVQWLLLERVNIADVNHTTWKKMFLFNSHDWAKVVNTQYFFIISSCICYECFAIYCLISLLTMRIMLFSFPPPFLFLFLWEWLWWHWLIKLDRFQVYDSIIYHLYVVLCAHLPESSVLASPFIPPLPSPTSATLLSFW